MKLEGAEGLLILPPMSQGQGQPLTSGQGHGPQISPWTTLTTSPSCSPNTSDLDALLTTVDNFAELKPLPPFDYQSSAPSNPSSQSQAQGSPPLFGDVVSSTTQLSGAVAMPANLKSELAEYLMSSDIDDIAALIGNAIADSTVPQLGMELDPNGVTSSTMSIDPWTELDAWIQNACNAGVVDELLTQTNGANNGANGGNTNNNSGSNSNSVNPNLNSGSAPNANSASNGLGTIQGATTLDMLIPEDSNYPGGRNNSVMLHAADSFQSGTSILQTRLQQPPSGPQNLLRIPQNPSSSTSPQQPVESSTGPYALKVDPYTLDPSSPSTTTFDPTVSPPGIVSSTQFQKFHHNNNMGQMRPPGNKAFYKIQAHQKLLPPHLYQNQGHLGQGQGPGGQGHGQGQGGQSYHGGQTHPHYFPDQASLQGKGLKNGGSGGGGGGGKAGRKSSQKSPNTSSGAAGSPPGAATSSIELDPLGKEKPIHRCGICNRGFLNKSNIKVHLRTHTGEKPFKCEVCGKAFRQKAHLLKHVQIHKRIQRD